MEAIFFFSRKHDLHESSSLKQSALSLILSLFILKNSTVLLSESQDIHVRSTRPFQSKYRCDVVDPKGTLNMCVGAHFDRI